MVIPEDVRHFLLTAARQSLEACVNRMARPQPKDVPAIAREKCGCFVTLTVHGQLRGCIGYLEGIAPLYEAVIQNAENAATKDYRFEPVEPRELKEISVEISVLTPPVPLEFAGPDDLLSKLVPNEDGIILHSGMHQSTFLPQVWEQLPDKVQFLEHLAVKGGMAKDGWKTASVKRYRAIHFSEPLGK
jgi:AmmeMemoRadiSam system protein A